MLNLHQGRMRLAVATLAMLVASATGAFAQSSITLAWDANVERDVAGYIVSWGTIPGVYPSSVNVGNATLYTVTGLNPDLRYQFVVQAYSTSGGVSVNSAPVSNNGFVVKTGQTLTDQRPSLFWHNNSTGQLSTWQMIGTDVADTRAVSIDRVADTSWFVAAVGDFNGDGHPDVLWRNSRDGSLAAWMLQNNDVIATTYLSISHVNDPAWRIAAAADVDGDGFADLIWQRSDGWLAVWFMRGTTVVSTRYLGIPRVADARWQIVAATDLDGDGCADLIWRDTTTGGIAAWYLRGTAVTFTQYLSVPQVADLTWQIVGAGHPDGSGQPVLVWQHTTDGSIAFWYLRGTTVTWTTFTNPGSVYDGNWKIVGSR